jgi:hypothetical protein
MELNLRNLTGEVVDHGAQDHVAALRHRGDQALCTPLARGFGFQWHVGIAGPFSVTCCTEFPANGIPSLRVRAKSMNVGSTFIVNFALTV